MPHLGTLESAVMDVLWSTEGPLTVREVLESLGPVVAKHPQYADAAVIRRLCEVVDLLPPDLARPAAEAHHLGEVGVLDRAAHGPNLDGMH